MTLILFDIDGTLTATSEADNGCYERAFFRAFQVPLPTTDWHAYTHATDIGIIREVIEPRRGTPVTTDEIDRFESAYVDELQRACDANPQGFAEVPGARHILETIRAAENLSAALATGGTRGPALFKLRKIGVDGAALPGAFANDAISRADIARLAIARTGLDAVDVVYVGDGLWDLHTAAEVGMRFIGITRESNADRLRAHGANALLEDYRDPDAFFNAVRTARIPRLP
jgi:phosphoglycolate phosphatase-like HAD superfamily hydrolase